MARRLRRAALITGCFAAVCVASAGCNSDEDPETTGGPSVSAGGFTSSKDNAYPCRAPRPFGEESSGYEECRNGLLIRSSVGECGSALPRAGDVDDYQFGIDECQNDEGCAQYPLGFCRRVAEDEDAKCAYGCLTDDDCASGLICLCGEPVGLCVPAACEGDDECLPGYHCASNDACGTSFACQHEDDACATDADCDEGHCVVEQQRRRCVTKVKCD